MVKEVTLKFDVNANSFKDGNLLLYDKNRSYFYAVTPEMFLNTQNQKIKELEKEYKQKEQNMKNEVEILKKEIKELHQHYDNFLESYKTTNAKLLEMVESFIKKYGGEN